MKRLLELILIALVFVLLAPFAQAQDAHRQRAMREQAVARLGPVARPIVESEYANEAIWALSSCSGHVATRLAKFHNSGELAKRPIPAELLRAIGQHGDYVALYILNHEELIDPDMAVAYVQNPIPYTLNIRSLEAGAAEVRFKRLQPQSDFNFSAANWPAIGGVALFILVGVAWWRRRRGVPAAV